MKSRVLFVFSPFQKILLVLIGVILVGTIFVSAYSITAHPERVGEGLRKADPAPTNIEKKAKNSFGVYEDIGRLRAITSDIPAISLVITPYFTYPVNDSAFFEEIVQKKRQMRSIILEYFALHSKDELINMGENAVKQELIVNINAALMLGQIENLYFNEYMFLN